MRLLVESSVHAINDFVPLQKWTPEYSQTDEGAVKSDKF